MLAAWFDRQGAAGEVLQLGELPVPEPGPGEVRVRVTASGVNPGDVKKRQAWLDSPMAFPLIVPHSDGAGRIDAVGSGVDPHRLGQRVWLFGAQSYRPFGTAAEATVVPATHAVRLPDSLEDVFGACLGIPGITAHRAVFADGAIAGQHVLVHGALGAVGSLAAQLARWGGATVIGTVRTAADLTVAAPGVADHLVSLDDAAAADQIRAIAADGVDRIIEVALGANADLDATVGANGAVIAAYASPQSRPEIPFWPLLFNNTVIRLLGSDDFPLAAKTAAAQDLTSAAEEGKLQIRIAPTFTLRDIATAHEMVEHGAPDGRVVLAIS